MVFSFDEFELDVEHQELRRSGRLLEVDALVLRLLSCLVRNAGELVTKDQLVNEVWEGRAIADNAITVSMARLRKLLGHRRGGCEYVATSYGRGYRFIRPVEQRSVQPSPLTAAGTAQAIETPFVGRERSLARLRRAATDARAGRGSACIVSGEPGIGKTRLIESFERELASSNAKIAWGYCREAGDTPPLWPWLRVLREVLAGSPQARLAAHVNGARELNELGAGVLPSTTDLAKAEWRATTRHRHFDALLRTFVKAAEHDSWVFVIDDLHRADAASLELLGQLLEEIGRTRLLVLATMRQLPGRIARATTQLPYVLGHRNCTRIALERLREPDVSAYVGALLTDPSGELGRAVFEKSEGNAFYMSELARSLLDSDTASPMLLSLPRAALDLVRQRIARLDPELRELLSCAAVIGRSFELPVLAQLAGREPVELMRLLDDALDADVVVAAPGSNTAFAFGHELLRSVLYDALSPQAQRRLHVRLARLLEQRLSAGELVPASELAYHFHAGLPESDLRQTVHFCRLASLAAADVLANADVVRYARHALEALELFEHPSARMRMSLLYIIGLCARGHAWHEAANATRELARLARERGDGPMLLAAARLMAAHPGFQPHTGSAIRETLEHALPLFRPEEHGWRAIALAGLACAAPNSYRADRSRPLLEEAVATVRRSITRLASYPVLALTLYANGGPDHEAVAAEAAEELEQLGQLEPKQTPVLVVELAFHAAVRGLRRGELPSVASALERSTRRCREVRHGELLWHSQRWNALTKIQTGTSRDGASELEDLHRRAQQTSIPGALPFVAFDRAVTLADLGRAPLADSCTRAALKFEAIDPPSMWALKLRAATSFGWHDEARAALRAVPPEELALLPCDRDYLGTLGHLARAAVALDMREYIDALEPLLARHPRSFAAGVAFYCEGAVPQLLALLATARGEHERAASQLEAAIAANDTAGFVLRAIEARLSLAGRLMRIESLPARRRAAALGREAGASAERFGLTQFARQAAALSGA